MNLIDLLTGFFILVMLGIFFAKLINVLKVGEWYEGKFIIVGFVGSAVSFLFVLVNVLHQAATSVEYVTYLWIMSLIFLMTLVLSVVEGLLKFTTLHPDMSNQRLTVDREYRR